MNNKALAIFGIGTYILSVISSATDLAGNSTMPVAVVVISGLATAAFIIIATICLWKESRGVAIALISSEAILFVLSITQALTASSYGSPLIILMSITKVISFIAFFYAIVILFKKKHVKTDSK